jgi:hypothetical protein
MVHTWKRMRGLRYRLARDRAMALGAVATAVVFARGCFVEIADPADPGDTDGGGTTGSGGNIAGSGGSVASGGTSGTAGTSPDANDGDDDAPDGCVSGEKSCGGTCVEIDDPRFGCSVTACGPCDLGNNLAARCSGGACEPDGCKPGFFDCDANLTNGCELHFGAGVQDPSLSDAGSLEDALVPARIPRLPSVAVNANLDDWSTLDVHRIQSACGNCDPVQPGGRPGPRIENAGGVPEDDDLAAYFAAAWNANGFYVAALMIDDDFQAATIDAGADAGSGEHAWRQDGIELFFDGKTLGTGVYDQEDHHVFVGAADESTFEENHGDVSGNFDIATGSQNRCHLVELRVKWIPYLDSAVPPAGKEIGFTIAVNDWDDSGTGSLREHQLFWRVPNIDYAYFTTGWARATLEP